MQLLQGIGTPYIWETPTVQPGVFIALIVPEPTHMRVRAPNSENVLVERVVILFLLMYLCAADGGRTDGRTKG